MKILNAYSIRLRLALWQSGVLTVTLGLFSIGLWFAVFKSIHVALEEDLGNRLSVVERVLKLVEDKRDNDELREALQSQFVLEPGTEMIMLRLFDESGKLIYQSESLKWYSLSETLPDEVVSSLRRRHDFPPLFETSGSIRRPLRIATHYREVGHRPMAVQVAARVDPFHYVLDRFFLTVLFCLPVVLAVASAGVYWVSRRGFAEVDEITGAARSISAGNLSMRLQVPQTGDELQRLSETLNGMFARLETAFRDLDEALKKVTRFTADASHELRTPVAVMRATTEIALQRLRTEAEYRAALEENLVEIHRISRLVEDLMMLAKADSRVEFLPRCPMDMVHNLEQACREGRKLAAEKQIRFRMDLPDDGIPIEGDGEAIRRLFLILIDNAVKYTPSGGVMKVTLAMDENHVVGKVEDSGIGISEADLPHIFERFYRADKARSRQMGGAGLGLSIAHWIVQVHGGEIRVESILGRGSTFTVTLPVLREEASRDSRRRATGIVDAPRPRIP